MSLKHQANMLGIGGLAGCWLMAAASDPGGVFGSGSWSSL